jgi:hypothetical protein
MAFDTLPHFRMFQGIKNRQISLRTYAAVQFIVAIFLICVPTAILLGVIAGRATGSDGAAVLVDASLGVILLFSSLIAIVVPWIYRNFAFEFPDPRTLQRLVHHASRKAMDRGLISIVAQNGSFLT